MLEDNPTTIFDGLTILGSKVSTPQKQLETFPKPSEMVREVEFMTRELTSLCPITGQPDFYELSILYLPRERCIESKSLKLYLWSFRQEGHFAEALAAIICGDMAKACAPEYVKVKLTMVPRGGIALTANAEWVAGDPLPEKDGSA